MKNLFRTCIYQGKNLYRERSSMFWILIYPLIMALFFYTAFNNLIDIKMEPINVGIEASNPMVAVFEEVEIFNISKLAENEGMEALRVDEIEGYIDDALGLKVIKSGFNQTLIKGVLDQVLQMKELGVPYGNFDFSIDYTQGKEQRSDTIIISFYTLFAMVATYGMFPAIELVNIIQANLSNLGKRMNIVPLKKRDFLIAGVFLALFLNIFSNILLFLFIEYILGLKLFTDYGLSLALILVANIFGVSVGIFLGVLNMQGTNAKTMLGIMLNLVASFFAGMMSSDVKIMLDERLPIVNKLNPISIITDNLFRLNLLDANNGFNGAVGVLLIYSIGLMLLSYSFLRRKTYDSI